MTKLNMKIHTYNEIQDSFQISFSTDVSIKSVDQYQKYAFQPHQLGITDPNELLEAIARTGLIIAKQQDLEDIRLADKTNVDAYKGLAGQTFEIDESEIPPLTTLTTVV